MPLLEPVELYPYATLQLPVCQNPFPSRPQTKSLSSHCASACSLPGRQSRLATSTCTRSAKGSLPAFCTLFVFGAKPSRMLSRPNSRHSQARYQHRSPAGGVSRFNGLGGLGEQRDGYGARSIIVPGLNRCAVSGSATSKSNLASSVPRGLGDRPGASVPVDMDTPI